MGLSMPNLGDMIWPEPKGDETGFDVSDRRAEFLIVHEHCIDRRAMLILSRKHSKLKK